MSQPAASVPASPNRSRPLEGVREQLIRRGMPLDYAERSVAELEDHHADLVDELRRDGAPAGDAERRAAERLGEPKQLVRRIVRDYQRRTLCGRWPLISFVLAPLPLLVIAWIGFELLLMFATSPWDEQLLAWGKSLSKQSIVSFVLALQFTTTVGVTAVVAYGYGHLALRATRSRVWAASVCLLLGVCAYAVHYRLEIRDVTGESLYHILFPSFSVTLSQVAQLLAPLAVGGWLIHGETKRRRRALRMEPPPREHRVAA